MELAKVKWFRTTGGKIGIVVGALALVTGVVLLVKHFTKKPTEEDKKLPPDETKTDTTTKPAETKTEVTPNEKTNPDLPNNGVGCSAVRTAFDRVYNYVKCAGVWYTISKDKIKIPKWKSLADNKTATDLLNNKYPS